MSWLLIAVVLIVAFFALAVLKGKLTPATGAVGFPYRPAGALFSPAERSFLGVLDWAVGTDYRVFGKVRVADVASVRPGLGNSMRQGALNRISQKHFDFVVCGARDLNIVCAVELNDGSHSSQRAQARDQLLVKVCQVIHLPLLQIPAKQSYALQDVRNQFLAATAQAGSAVGRPPLAHRER